MESNEATEIKGDVIGSALVSHLLILWFIFQRRVYDDVGQSVLQNAWDGYNSTLFAYGQTGSGKSWSIVGYGVNRGTSNTVMFILYF